MVAALPLSLRAGVHAPTKLVSVPAAISLPPVNPRSAVHTDRQNRYRRLQGGQFREWCRAVNMAPMWNRRFYLLCLLHLRRRRRLKRREREFWEHPIVAARTLEGAYYRVSEKDCTFFKNFIYQKLGNKSKFFSTLQRFNMGALRDTAHI